MKCVILGAGLSGLSCGIGLIEAGHDVMILEKESTVGGLCRSFRRDGFTFDYGPHFVFGREARDLLQDRLTPSLSIPAISRTGERIVTHDRLFQFPFDPRSILRHMGKGYLLLALMDLVITRTLRDRESPVDLREWIVGGVGKTIYEYIDLPGYVQKLYGLPPNRISAEWGRQKLKFLAAWRDRSLFLLSLQALNETKRLRRKVVSYPRRGIEAIPVALAERFLEMGGEIKTSAAAVSVEEQGDRAEVRISGGQAFACDLLFSSIPLPTLVRLLPEGHGKRLGFLSEDLRQRKTIFFMLYFDTPKVMDHGCLYFTQPHVSFRRVTEFKHLSPSMAPPDKTSLCVEVTADDDEEPDVSRERIEVFLDELDQTGHCDVRDYTRHDVKIIPNTYPVYRREYSEALTGVLTHLSSLRRVLSFGRQGLFFYNTMSNSVIDGHRLGRGCPDAASFSTLRDAFYRERMGLIQSPQLR